MYLFGYFYTFLFKNFLFFLVLVCKGLLPEPTWEIFLACLIALEYLCEVFGCSIITDFVFFSSSNKNYNIL